MVTLFTGWLLLYAFPGSHKQGEHNGGMSGVF